MKIPEKYRAFRIDIEKIFSLLNIECPDLTSYSVLHVEISISEITIEIFWELYFEKLVESSVTELDLSNANLKTWSDETWFMMGNAIMGSKLKSLNLSGNNLQNCSNQQFQALCIAIASSKLASIDFRDCQLLNFMSDARWELFCTFLAKSKLASIYLAEPYSASISRERLLQFPNAFSASAFLIKRHYYWDQRQALLSEACFNNIDRLLELKNSYLKELAEFGGSSNEQNNEDFISAIYFKQQEIGAYKQAEKFESHSLVAEQEFIFRAYCHALATTKQQTAILDGSVLSDLKPAAWSHLGKAIARSNLHSFDWSTYGSEYAVDWKSPINWNIFCSDLCMSKLESIDLSRCYSFANTRDDWRLFWNAMCESKTMRKIKLNDTLIGHDTINWNVFWSAIAKSNLKELEVGDNGFHIRTDEEIAVFCAGIINSKLVALNIGGNYLGDRDVDNLFVIADTLEKSSVTELSFTNESLSNWDNKKFARLCQLIANKKWTLLGLSKINFISLSKPRFDSLWQAIALSQLNKLNLSDTDLLDDKIVPKEFYNALINSNIQEIWPPDGNGPNLGKEAEFWRAVEKSKIEVIHFNGYKKGGLARKLIEESLYKNENCIAIDNEEFDEDDEIKWISDCNVQVRDVCKDIKKSTEELNKNLLFLYVQTIYIIEKIKETDTLNCISAREPIRRRLQKLSEQYLQKLCQHEILNFHLLDALPEWTELRIELYQSYFHRMLVTEGDATQENAEKRLVETVPHAHRFLCLKQKLSQINQTLFDTTLQSATGKKAEPGEQDLTLEMRISLLQYFVLLKIKDDELLKLQPPYTKEQSNNIALFWKTKKDQHENLADIWDYAEKLQM